ncbi:MAG: hypothetical protein WAL22_16020 [Solirubrobacteraceae bacterium]
MNKYQLAAPLAGAVLALALAGCGSSHSNSHSTQTATKAPASSTTASATSTTAAAARTTASQTSAVGPDLARLHAVKTLGSTVPANGDVNPYGLIRVSSSVGTLHAGSFLVSNFNDKANDQGTGTTIEQITPSGKRTQFAQIPSKLPGACPGGVGLTTALNVLPGGYVVVGSLPTSNGKSATAKYGCLIELNRAGHVIGTIAGANIQGPWDMTAVSHGDITTLFVSNALNGGAVKGKKVINNSTVLRIRLQSSSSQAPKVLSQQVVGDRIPWIDNSAALVIGPTGVALASDGTLYVADTLDNRISAISHALTRTTPAQDGGTTVTKGQHLKQPLGLILAPNGNILTTNAGNGNIVETTPAGRQLVARTADTKTGAGSLFGLATAPGTTGIYFVDDGDNTLKLLH